MQPPSSGSLAAAEPVPSGAGFSVSRFGFDPIGFAEQVNAFTFNQWTLIQRAEMIMQVEFEDAEARGNA